MTAMIMCVIIKKTVVLAVVVLGIMIFISSFIDRRFQR